MRMSNDISIDYLSGLALDWLIGQSMGYTLTILEAGTKIDKFTLSRTRVFLGRGTDNKSNVKVVPLLKKVGFDGLTLFNPSQDWELIPAPASYKNRGSIEAVNIYHSYQKDDENNYLLNNWLCRYINDGEQSAIHGDTKEEAICRAIVDMMGGWWHAVPAILLEQDVA